MDFRFTEEQLMIQDVARRIAQEKIAPTAAEHDRSGEFPSENIRILGENGLMGIEVPSEYGGAGMGYLAHVVAMEEISWGQRILGFEGPPALVAANQQDEANLHNLLGRYALHGLYIVIGVWGIGVGRYIR